MSKFYCPECAKEIPENEVSVTIGSLIHTVCSASLKDVGTEYEVGCPNCQGRGKFVRRGCGGTKSITTLCSPFGYPGMTVTECAGCPDCEPACGYEHVCEKE